MSLEWSVAGLLLAVALWPLWRKTRSWSARAATLCLVVAAILGAFAWKSRVHVKRTARAQFLEKVPRNTRTNGYVSSQACRACHPDQYASWHRSFHRTMTQHATPEAVRGQFTNVTLTLAGEQYHLSRRGDEFYVDMVDPDWKYVRLLREEAFKQGREPAPPPPEANPPRVQKRITMTTGSHHMQAYWVAGEFGNQQFSLPFTYLFEEERWAPRNDVFLLPPDTPPLQQVWNSNCIQCHSTVGVPGQDPKTYVIDSRVVELGISCESCHGPAEEHIRANNDPTRRYALHRNKERDPTIRNPERMSSHESSEACGQCHATRYHRDERAYLQHGYPHKPGDSLAEQRPLPRMENLRRNDESPSAPRENPRILFGTFWNDGMVRVSGREYNGLIETGCFKRGELSCLSCHSMHKMVSTDDQLKPALHGNQACLQCHSEYATKLEQHTHHAANSSGSLCYNCHMPHTTYGLLKSIRSHQIDSPSAQSSLTTGRPNACNLCHLDRSLAWTATNLTHWYRHPLTRVTDDFAQMPASVVWLLRGDAGQRALIAWHMGWEPAKKISGDDWLAPYLTETLNDPYSVVRHIAQRSLKRLPGFEAFSFDYIASPEQRVQGQLRAAALWQERHASGHSKIIPRDDFIRLVQRRNNREMELLE